MRLIFLGPPGAGKGTQAERIANQWQIPHISTGEILRHAIANQTPLGLKAKAYVDAGELVTDQLVINLIQERLGQKDTERGWILDGFPRSLSQAYALDHLLQNLRQPYSQVINFQTSTEILVKRMLERGRQDDNEVTIRRRLKVYQEKTAPLIQFYQKRGCLQQIDGNASIEVVNQILSGTIQEVLSV